MHGIFTIQQATEGEHIVNCFFLQSRGPVRLRLLSINELKQSKRESQWKIDNDSRGQIKVLLFNFSDEPQE